MSAPWDAFQRDALAALGHDVYRQADAAPAVPAMAPDAAGSGAQARLLGALARAAGVPVDGLPGLPPLAQLRSAAAKRALWPRLRALRAATRR